MNIDKAVFTFAGIMVLLGLALGWFVSPWFYLLTLLVGLNLLQAGITGFCPAARFFRALGMKAGPAFF